MPTHGIQLDTDIGAINRGFSKQSFGYDEADRTNIILQDLRQQVYQQVENFLSPRSRILELNAGTGLDAMHFASNGHDVHATDITDGMIAQIKNKISSHPMSGRLTFQQVSFEELDKVQASNFDFVFSNFGGLNCTQDLEKVTRHLPSLLKPKGYVAWVIMPRICPWELLWILKGKPAQALRRLKQGGVRAHLEGEYFQTYYHSLSDIRSALGSRFEFIHSQSLALLSPPPHATALVEKYPRLYKLLRALDATARNIYPFNRWGDHIIVTFRFHG